MNKSSAIGFVRALRNRFLENYSGTIESIKRIDLECIINVVIDRSHFTVMREQKDEHVAKMR